MSDGPADATLVREFDDNAGLQALFGPHNTNLERIERQLGVALNPRGNSVAISGPAAAAGDAAQVLAELYALARRQGHLETAEVDAAVRMARHVPEPGEDVVLRTRKRHIAPRTPVQADYIRAMNRDSLVFGLGPAGTGTTYLAVAKAVSMMLEGEVDRIILSRPAVEAGERLGFLPGDLKDKVDPYLRPLYDALYDMLPGDQVIKKLTAGDIEVAPLAFMRGRTLTNAFIIHDEAQNTTPEQMKMFLTRIGFGSKCVVTGDVTQIDVPGGRSGLLGLEPVLGGIDDIAFVHLSRRDIIRHKIVADIVDAYEVAEGRAGPTQ